MRKLLLATAALLALTTASPAAVIDVGVNPTSATGRFDSPDGGTGGTGLGSFMDQITFQLVGGPQFLTIASATNVFPNTTDFITNFTAQGFQIVGTIGGGDDIPVTALLSAVACPQQDNCQGFAGNALLNPGNYYLELEGIGGGTSGYGGNLSVVAVPIPAVGAGVPGVIAAFSLFGVWLRRRRREAIS